MTELIRNIIKGAASLTLFPDQGEIEALRKEFPHPRSTEDAWKEDWSNIGSDFRKAISNDQTQK